MSEIISEKAWHWISQQESFQSPDLAIELTLSKKKTKAIIQHLAKKGLIKTISRKSKPYLYAAMNVTNPKFSRGSCPPPIKNGRLLIWRAMRWQGEFSNSSIAAITEQNPNGISRYIRILTTYGYVKVTRAPSARVKGLYRLVKYTGPKNPQTTKSGLYDPNLGQVLNPIKEVK
jgi:Mn-dependent DtxR family transcriptional regulator